VSKPLAGRVAVVAGATRGAGRGIARMLGEAGATVYCTGRSTRGSLSPIGRPETIEETAEMVSSAGGQGVAVRTDHSQEQEVASLFERVRAEAGRLDILVNDIGGEDQAEWQPIWKANLGQGFAFVDTAVRTHIITSRYGVPLMREQGRGLIIEITDGDHGGYRGSFFYDLVKNQVIRIAYAMSVELAAQGITAIAVTPGFLRSEAMLENFGVSEDNWQDAIPKAMGFSESETPCFVGRAVAALAADPHVHEKTGQVLASWTLAREYGFTDIDGRRPDWWAFVERSIEDLTEKGGPETDEERYWVHAWHTQLKDQPEHAALAAELRRLVPE
jgi:NAD(P)-dependent dehydrogenase (short-subunit alcohol dehydrogenase family)